MVFFCAPALYHHCKQLFPRLRYPYIFNDSSTRSCSEGFTFGAFLCAFFCSSVCGRRWVQHLRDNPRSTGIGCERLCLWRKRIFFSRRGLTPPKQAVCVVLPVSPARCLCLVPPAEGIRWSGEQRALVRPESAVHSCHLQLPAGTAAASPAPQASSRPDMGKPPLI